MLRVKYHMLEHAVHEHYSYRKVKSHLILFMMMMYRRFMEACVPKTYDAYPRFVIFGREVCRHSG